MSEVYWIAGVKDWDKPGKIDTWLNSIGVKANWIDEAFWLSDSINPPAALPSRHLSSWPITGVPAHRLLQLIISDMSLDQNSLVLLVEEFKSALSLAVLGTPRSVGRYNLLPIIRLCAMNWWPSDQYPEGIEIELHNHLTKIEVQSQSIDLLALARGKNNHNNIELPGANKIELQPGCGLIESLLMVIGELIRRSVKTGLYIDRNATLLEVV